MMNNPGVMGPQVSMPNNPNLVQGSMGPGVPPQQMMPNPQANPQLSNQNRQANNDDYVARCLLNTQRLRENLEILLNTTKQAAMIESEDSLNASSSANVAGAPNSTSTNNPPSSQANNTLKNTIDRKLLEMSQSLDAIGQAVEQYDFKIFLSQHTNIGQYNELALEKQGTLLDEWSSNIKWLNKLTDLQSYVNSTLLTYRRNIRQQNTVSRQRIEGSSRQNLERIIQSIDPPSNQNPITQQQMTQTNKDMLINIQQRCSDHLNILEISLLRSGIIVLLFLRHLTVEHVVCKPLNEKKQFGASFYHKIPSNYQALKLIAGHIRAASLYFCGPGHQSDAGLTKLIQYISRYNTLHSSKCIGCQKHLLNGLQPTWRDFKSTEVYHEECLN